MRHVSSCESGSGTDRKLCASAHMNSAANTAVLLMRECVCAGVKAACAGIVGWSVCEKCAVITADVLLYVERFVPSTCSITAYGQYFTFAYRSRSEPAQPA